MHIQEGFQTAGWAVTWFGVATVFVGKGLHSIVKKAKKVAMYKPLVGLLGAVVFFMSLIPVPFPALGTSSHPAGTPLAAILLGPFATMVLSVVALVLQATFFAHGGFTTLGANVVSMGVVGSLVTYGVFKLVRRAGLSLALAAGLGGFLGDLSVYLMASIELTLGMPKMPFGTFANGLLKFLVVYMPTQLPIAALEGILTAGVITYVAKVRPDILRSLGLLPPVSEVKPDEEQS